jgi:hypothetical protein
MITCKTCDKCVKDEKDGTAYCMEYGKYLTNLDGKCDHWDLSIFYELGYFTVIITSILGIAGLIMLILGTVNYYKNLGG